MFSEKRKCENCENVYDDRLQSCPYCKQNNPLPRLESAVTHYPPLRQILLFLVGLPGLFLIEFIVLIPIYVYAINQHGLEEASILISADATYLAAITFLSYGLLLVALIFTIFPTYTPLLKTFKGWKPYVAAIAGIVAIYVFNILYNLILSAFFEDGISVNANEASVQSIVTLYPILSLIVIGFVAPICEELTYRVGLFSYLKRIHVALAYAVGILIFAFVHFDFSSFFSNDYVTELLNLPYYLFPAAVLTFLYHHFGYASSTTCHILNNAISVIAVVIS